MRHSIVVATDRLPKVRRELHSPVSRELVIMALCLIHITVYRCHAHVNTCSSHRMIHVCDNVYCCSALGILRIHTKLVEHEQCYAVVWVRSCHFCIMTTFSCLLHVLEAPVIKKFYSLGKGIGLIYEQSTCTMYM